MGRICFFLAYGLLPIWVALFVILKEEPDAYGVTLWAPIIGVLISVVTFCLAVCTSFVYDKVKGSHVRKLLVSGSFLLVINAAFAVIRYRDHKLEANQEAFRKRIEQAAESLVKYDPFVKEQSIGDPLHFGAVWSRMGGNRLPTRVTVSVGQESRQNLYAEVDVEATITSQGTLGEV
jgi:glucan phosphoethanolaminetransferase (alkaline phosphatase superfamily)